MVMPLGRDNTGLEGEDIVFPFSSFRNISACSMEPQLPESLPRSSKAGLHCPLNDKLEVGLSSPLSYS